MKKLMIPFILILSACAGADDSRPTVVLNTDLGDIQIEVHSDMAPISAADFLKHVDEGLYDQQGFYRVVRADNDPRDMGMSLIQGGLLSQDPVTPPIAHERTTTTELSNVRGTVSIARDAPGTGSAAYFFINAGDNSFLDTGGSRNPDGEGYASFGTVVSGMEVVDAIQAQEAKGDSPDPVTDNQYLTDPVIIQQAYRLQD